MDDGPRLRDHLALLGLAIGGAVLEEVLLLAFGAGSAGALAPQATAPPPFAVFHDLRWLLVYHSSHWAFVLEALALIAVRTAVTAALVGTAWPRGSPRPEPATLARAAGLFVAVTAVLLLPWAALAFGVAIVPLSWPLFVSMPAVVVVALVVHQAVAGNGGWRHSPGLRTAGWVLLTFVVLSLAGAAISASPWWPAKMAAVAATGLFNGWAWLGIVRSVVRRTDPLPVPMAPIGIAALAVVILVGAAIGFSTVTATTELRGDVTATPDGRGQPVLMVTGFASHWDGSLPRPLPGDFTEWRFSYRGADADGRALPYRGADTDRSLGTLVDAMSAQVEAIAARSGRPVAIVAESEGALVAKSYLLTRPGAPVSDLVLLSPLVDPARVYYPPAGQEGWGVVSRALLSGAVAAIRWLSPLDLSVDGPLVRSIVDHVELRRALDCAVPGVREEALFPLADAVTGPRTSDLQMQSEVLPSFHGGLLGNGSARRAVALALEHRPLPHRAALALADRLIRDASSAWQVPELSAGLNAAWAGAPRDCAHAPAALAARLR